MQRLKSLFKDIKNKFTKKKEKTIEVPLEWVKQEKINGDLKEPNDPELETIAQKQKTVKHKILSFKKPRKIKLKFLKLTKRFLASFLLLLHGTATFLSFNNPIIALFFGATSIILLDYLWKSKMPKMEWSRKK